MGYELSQDDVLPGTYRTSLKKLAREQGVRDVPYKENNVSGTPERIDHFLKIGDGPYVPKGCFVRSIQREQCLRHP